ncbi:insecticidal toxin complex protein TccC [Pseudomonas sp. NFACC02]|uniref:RHS repeat domain-containing protein n=1 Tax=Pseudomonas sp. NFACC02 TaxID=1566250 RepID=UPI0008B0B040|nr:RHS repeat-associated core domain-containing protein [Pseudomonas sp. NFACC02]SER47458.1 insecticidal toxin complex protein TccC [Pseudomonas sp. NFACC02]
MPASIMSVHTATPKVIAHDSRGRIVREIECYRSLPQDATELRISRQRFDDAGRLVASQDPRLGVTAGSDANLANRCSLSGNVLCSESVDAGWRVRLLGEAGETRATWDALGQTRSNGFDASLRLTTVTERGADGLSRVVERLTYGAADQSAHNLCGLLVRHDDTAITRGLPEYDVRGTPVVEQQYFLLDLDTPDWPEEVDQRDALLEPDPAITRVFHNALGEVLQQTDAKQTTRRFAYDVAGHLKAVSLQRVDAEPEVVIRDVSFNALDEVERETAGNGVVTSIQYCAEGGRLLHLESGLPGQAALQRLAYQYDPVGNVTAIEDTAQPTVFFRNQVIDHTNSYRYDSLYQLCEASGYEALRVEPWRGVIGQYRVAADTGQLANYRENYEYDAAGNLLTLTHSGGHSFTQRMIVSAFSNRSLQVQGDWVPDETDITQGFDAHGNQRELLRGQMMSWDARNQLEKLSPVSRAMEPSDSERYFYDGAGQRVRKVQVAQARGCLRTREVRYLPGLQPHSDSVNDKAWQIVEVQAGLNRVRWTEWGSGTPSGMREVFGRYSVSDHLGSVTLELDEVGNVLSQESYYPFGGTAWWVHSDSEEGSLKTRRYAGKEKDASGLYYYGMRYYAPWLSRWINADPWGNIDGLNLYRFVRNNPITLNDPVGLSPAVTLLYGFDDARNLYFKSLSKTPPAPGTGTGDAGVRSVVTIDALNIGIGITGETFRTDYALMFERLRDGYKVEDAGVNAFLNEAGPHYKGSRDEARVMLQNWFDFLRTNRPWLDIRMKINRYKAANQPDKIRAFWNKNIDVAFSDRSIERFSDVLVTDPGALYFGEDENSHLAKTGLNNWLFRRTSKLGLEWIARRSQGHPGSVTFLDVVPVSLSNPGEGWLNLTREQYEAQRYKSWRRGVDLYEPITFSERRYIDREMQTSRAVRLIKADEFRRSLH